MRRFYVAFLCVIITALFIGCGKKRNQDNYYKYSEDISQYEFDDMVSCFDVSRNGSIYCVTSINEEMLVNDSLEYGLYSNLSVLDETGEVIETYEIPGNVSWIQLEEENECVYYLDVMDWFQKRVYCYEFINNSAKLLWEIPEGQTIKNIFVIDEDIYVFGYDTSENLNQSVQMGFQNNFIGKVDLTTGQIDKLPIDSPCSVSETVDHNLVIYVYEDDTTYYFIEYDVLNQSFGKKIYHFMQGAIQFYICNEKDGYLYIKFKQDRTYLTYCELESDAVEVELMPYEKKELDLKLKYGNMFQLDKEQNVIKRVKNSLYMNDNKEIVLLSPMYYQGRNPFGCGYRMKNIYKNQEELALSILARDSDYDLFLVNSDLQIAQNIRTKGSFYPLNEVDGVQEYLDACFPYIKDVAINGKGDIWMIPVYLDMPVLLYQETTCDDYGCSSTGSLSVDEFFTWMNEIQQKGSTDELAYMNRTILVRNMVNQYCNQCSQFDTLEFRNLAVNVKDSLNYLGGDEENYHLVQQVLEGQQDKFLFIYLMGSLVGYINDIEGCSLAPIPYLSDKNTNLASCQFIAVNPDSKNLKVVLEYISDLCKYLMSQKSPSMIIQEDTSTFTRWEREKYEIYSNGEIGFSLPNEIVMEQLEAYLRDEISLEELIQEADRRLAIYMEE